MPTSRNRLGMRASCMQDRFNAATLQLVLGFDRMDIQQGNYSDCDELFDELDRERSEEGARLDGDR